jgi:hypothetical protein
MAQGFTLVYDPDVTVYREVKIASGTAVASGTVVDQSHSGSSTVDVATSTGSSVTSTIYGVTVGSISSSATTVKIALITPRQVWACDAGATSSTGGGTASAAYNGLRSVLGTMTFTVGTTALPAGLLTYTSSTGVKSFNTGDTMTCSTCYNTGSDVTGTTGVFLQQGLLATISTSRIVGRFLIEHAA